MPEKKQTFACAFQKNARPLLSCCKEYDETYRVLCSYSSSKPLNKNFNL